MGRGPRTRSEPGFTLVELIIILSIIALLAAIAAVGLTRSRASANEAAAVHALRTIQSAQDAFRATCGHGREYATSLPQLGAANLISSDMATGPVVTKSRYVITIAPTAPGEAADSCTNGETAAHWYATAVPEAGLATHGFATADQDDIWKDSSGAAPQQPFTPSDKVSRAGSP